MISFEAAKALILEKTFPLEKYQSVVLDKLTDRVMAQPLIAQFDMPRFDNSAMDGFGVRVIDLANASQDTPISLTLQDTVQAGDPGSLILKPDHAIKILTGAPVPPGVEAVVMKEFCTEHNGTVAITRTVKLKENIRFKGEEFTKGQVILEAGIRITPPVIGLIAGMGHTQFGVYAQPRIALLSTGNEIIPPGQPLQPGQIYDSNSFSLKAALQQMGLTQVSVFYAKDDLAETTNAFQQALEQHDVIITLGGVSVGDYDVVKEVLEKSGVETIFWRIAMKPGKPVYFGIHENTGSRKMVFGLPGNPVSALVTFHELVRPTLLKMSHKLPDTSTNPLTARLSRSLKKKAGRLELVRGFLSASPDGAVITPTVGQDSHMLGGLSKANSLIIFPEDAESLPEGSEVEIEPLHWSH